MLKHVSKPTIVSRYGSHPNTAIPSAEDQAHHSFRVVQGVLRLFGFQSFGLGAYSDVACFGNSFTICSNTRLKLRALDFPTWTCISSYPFSNRAVHRNDLGIHVSPTWPASMLHDVVCRCVHDQSQRLNPLISATRSSLIARHFSTADDER